MSERKADGISVRVRRTTICYRDSEDISIAFCHCQCASLHCLLNWIAILQYSAFYPMPHAYARPHFTKSRFPFNDFLLKYKASPKTTQHSTMHICLCKSSGKTNQVFVFIHPRQEVNHDSLSTTHADTVTSACDYLVATLRLGYENKPGSNTYSSTKEMR